MNTRRLKETMELGRWKKMKKYRKKLRRKKTRKKRGK